MPILWHETRSVRVTVTPAEGPAVVIENLSGNDGYEVDFSATRTMDPSLGECSVSIYNLPIEVRGAIESASVRAPDDLDQILSRLGNAQGWQVFGSGVDSDGDDAETVGLATVKIEAGYDGAVSEVFEAVAARVRSKRADDTTYVTTIEAVECLDAALYSRPETVFPAGSPTYDVMNTLRTYCGLGIGNATAAQWTALLGASTIDSPYYSASTDGFEALAALLDFLPLRWFIDGRELWIVAKDGQPQSLTAPPPYIPETIALSEPLIARPERLEGGFVGVQTLMMPTALPGRLLPLSAAALGLESVPTPAQIRRAEVPPGIYRIEEVSHDGTTSAGGDFVTAMRLKPMQV